MNDSNVDLRITAELILDLLNDKIGIASEIMDFYSGYIKTAATLNACNSGIYDNVFSEDLAQEMRIGLVKSIPIFRGKLLKQKHSEPIVIIIS